MESKTKSAGWTPETITIRFVPSQEGDLDRRLAAFLKLLDKYRREDESKGIVYVTGERQGHEAVHETVH